MILAIFKVIGVYPVGASLAVVDVTLSAARKKALKKALEWNADNNNESIELVEIFKIVEGYKPDIIEIDNGDY